MADHAPLTPSQRREVQRIVADVDPDLADALAAELELDPTVRLLLRGVEAIRDQAASDARETRAEVLAELRATRWQLTGVVVLAMAILGGMVGLSLSIDGGSQLPAVQVTPGAVRMSAPTIEVEPPAVRLDDDPDPAPLPVPFVEEPPPAREPEDDGAVWVGDSPADPEPLP